MLSVRFLINFLIVSIANLIVSIKCHARLLMPIARSSAWRSNPILFPTYYNDNAMSCGGVRKQWQNNGGKCGICGDDISMKFFEKGGKYYRGIKVKSYKKTDLIEAVVEVTESHKGYFEFRLCNVDYLNGDATQECLDKNLLVSIDGRTRIPVPKGYKGILTTHLKIPTGFKCDRCVFQWKYNSGNSWNKDFKTGKGCVGCGPQEQFYGCADISIDLDKKMGSFAPTMTTVTRNKFVPSTETSKLTYLISKPFVGFKPYYKKNTVKIQYKYF